MNTETGEIRRFAVGEAIPPGYQQITEQQAQIAEEIDRMERRALLADDMRQLHLIALLARSATG